MKNIKIYGILIVLTLILLSGCTNTPQSDKETSPSNTATAETSSEEVAIEEPIAEEATNEEAAVEAPTSEASTDVEDSTTTDTASEEETSTNNDNSPSAETTTEVVAEITPNAQEAFATPTTIEVEFNEAYMEEAKELNYPTPFLDIIPISYVPSASDIVQYDASLTGVALFDSLTHKGFTGNILEYNKNKVRWDDFFDDLDHTDNPRTVTITLKNESIQETSVVDENEIYHRFYDENEGIYYEVNELMLGNYTDEDAVLTKAFSGMSCMYKGFDGLAAPTHNPFILKKIDEYCINASITSLEGQPSIFVETLAKDVYSQYWVSIEKGVILKRIAFNSDGLPQEIDTLTSTTTSEIQDTVFHQPYDVDFMDITMFIFGAENGDKIEVLGESLIGLLPEDEFSMTLENNLGGVYEIHCTGFGDTLKHAIYICNARDINNKELTLRSYHEGGYYTTICDEKKLVTLYGSSTHQKKFFDFEKTGFAGYREDGDLSYYIFRNMDKGSVSGLIEFYQYEIDKTQKKLNKVSTFHKESLTSVDIFGEVIDYTITSFGEADESLFVDYPEDYEVINHGEESHDDGEHMPAWYQ